jgi:superfamily II DNA/RNA helicase
MEKELVDWHPDMVIADESQKIKNGQARQSKAMKAISKPSKFRLILTGTPVPQRPLDFFSQYQFLNSSVFGSSFLRFRERYAVMGGYMGYEVVGYQNLEELAGKAHSIAFRVRKQDCLDLPATVNQKLYVDLDPEAKAIYHKMEKDALLALDDEKVTAPIVLTMLLRLQQITGGFIPTESKTHLVSKAKLETLKETVEDLVEAGKKVVIFARFTPEVHSIAAELHNMGIQSFMLDGSVPQAKRAAIIKAFQEEDKVRVFIAQIATGGVGITLHAADTMIFYSVDFNLANYEQAKARIHRIGQTQKVTYIHLVARGTIDEMVLERLASKQDLAKLVVDDLKGILLNSSRNSSQNPFTNHPTRDIVTNGQGNDQKNSREESKVAKKINSVEELGKETFSDLLDELDEELGEIVGEQETSTPHSNGKAGKAVNKVEKKVSKKEATHKAQRVESTLPTMEEIEKRQKAGELSGTEYRRLRDYIQTGKLAEGMFYNEKTRKVQRAEKMAKAAEKAIAVEKSKNAAKAEKFEKEQKAKAEQTEAPKGEAITPATLAKELGVEPTAIRRFLRSKHGAQHLHYEWTSEAPEVAEVREHFTKN